MKKLNDETFKKIKMKIKELLHASRDSLRNTGKNTSKTIFSLHNTFYSETIGIITGIKLLGYNIPSELSLEKLKEEVLREEGFYTDHRCEYCLKTFGKDDKTELEKMNKIKEIIKIKKIKFEGALNEPYERSKYYVFASGELGKSAFIARFRLKRHTEKCRDHVNAINSQFGAVIRESSTRQGE